MFKTITSNIAVSFGEALEIVRLAKEEILVLREVGECDLAATIFALGAALVVLDSV